MPLPKQTRAVFAPAALSVFFFVSFLAIRNRPTAATLLHAQLAVVAVTPPRPVRRDPVVICRPQLPRASPIAWSSSSAPARVCTIRQSVNSIRLSVRPRFFQNDADAVDRCCALVTDNNVVVFLDEREPVGSARQPRSSVGSARGKTVD